MELKQNTQLLIAAAAGGIVTQAAVLTTRFVRNRIQTRRLKSMLNKVDSLKDVDLVDQVVEGVKTEQTANREAVRAEASAS